jgi:glycosyltransferase involved in cell wall biosynthesis
MNFVSTEPGPPFRILHVAQKLPGGVGAYLDEVLRFQLDDLGPERVSALIAAPEREHLAFLPDTSVHTFPGSDRTLSGLWRFAAEVRRTVRRERPDIVHLHSTFAGLTRPLLWGRGRPGIVYCSHGWSFNMAIPTLARRLLVQIERALAHGTERIICVSRFERDSAARRGIRTDRLEVIHNGVADRPVSARAPAFPNERINLLFIGRLDRQKGLDIALAAMAELADFPVHLHVIGAGVLAPGGQQHRLPNVTYYGWQTRDVIPSYVEASDAVMVPSRWEAFGLAAIEAMRQARPVLASRIDALPEVVKDCKTGFLFAPEDPAAIVALVRRLDRDRLRSMGTAAREDFVGRFTGERMNRRIIRLYREVLADASAARKGLSWKRSR